MIYGPGNCQKPAHVWDVDRVEQFDSVVSVDTDRSEVTCCRKPLRLSTLGDEVDTFKVRFRSIYPIYDLCPPSADSAGIPTLFHCYGRDEPPFPAGI